jgi:hypothetical protein
MLDTAYNGMVFHSDQVLFPKTAARESLRRALRAMNDDAVGASGPRHLGGVCRSGGERHRGECDR